jgi:hypothetical protein
MTDQTRTRAARVCANCGRNLDEPGAVKRVAIGRRYSARYGFHNATRSACAYCETLTRWGDPPAPRNEVELVDYAHAFGSHFFDPETMRFFSSRLAPDVTIHPDRSRVWFVTSERSGFDRSSPRAYTVRAMYPGAVFTDPDGFGAFGSLRTARAAIREHVREASTTASAEQ